MLLRKDDGYIGRRMLRIELPGKRKRGRPKRRFMDVVREDMAEVEVTEMGRTGDGKSVVATSDGKSRKKKKILMIRRFMDVVREDMAEVEVTEMGRTGDG